MTRKEIFMTQLIRRSERLQRLIELKAPEYCLCNEAILIFRAATGLNPEITGKVLGEYLGREARLSMGCCAYGDTECNNIIAENQADVVEAATCPECKKLMEKQWLEDDLEAFGLEHANAQKPKKDQ